MVAVKEVNLGAMNVSFPEGGVGMVVAQPFLDLTPEPPFACAAAAQARLMDCVDATLDIARRKCHGANKTHFTVFPEYTIPGVQGVARIDAAMAAQDWPTSTVVVGGLEGMTAAQFREFVDAPDVDFDNEHNCLDRLQDDQWVNCCVTWVKLPSNEVRKWVQPKICPAWEEKQVLHSSMYCGQSVFLFKGRFENGARPYRFLSLLCFDWIGAVGNKRVWEWVLESMNEEARKIDALLPLTWVYVLQYNEEPCHPSFMHQVPRFYDKNHYTSVERHGACLLMANAAGKDRPGRVTKYGRSAVIHAPLQFGKAKCPPTYCSGGSLFRPGNPLENFSDSLFREGGACIHSFIQSDPVHTPNGAAGKNPPLRSATVHPFPGTNDPRTGGSIAAATKWLHDTLDDLDDDRCLSMRHPGYPLAAASRTPSDQTVEALRHLAPREALHSIDIACVNCKPTPDHWTTDEIAATEHLQHTLSILKLVGYDLVVHGEQAHATAVSEGSFDVVAVRGPTHSIADSYILNKGIRARHRLVIVSRDDDNTIWGREERSILDTASDEGEVRITDPRSGTKRIGYQTFLEAYRTSTTTDQLREKLDAVLY